MSKRKNQETQAEQSARFLAHVEKLIDAGELNPTEAEEALDRLVRSQVKLPPNYSFLVSRIAIRVRDLSIPRVRTPAISFTFNMIGRHRIAVHEAATNAAPCTVLNKLIHKRR